MFGMMTSAYLMAAAAYVNAGATVPLHVGGTAIVVAGVLTAAGGYMLLAPVSPLPATVPLQILALVAVGGGTCLSVVPVVPIILSDTLHLGGGVVEVVFHTMWYIMALAQVLGPLVLGTGQGERADEFPNLAILAALLLGTAAVLLVITGAATRRFKRGCCTSLWAISVVGCMQVVCCIDDADAGALGERDVGQPASSGQPQRRTVSFEPTVEGPTREVPPSAGDTQESGARLIFL